MIRKFIYLFTFLIGYLFTIQSIAASREAIMHQPVPVDVKVSVKNANAINVISICNISSAAIPMTNVEFSFNYDHPMPTNIWGNPWAAWKLVSQTGKAVLLQGGTPFTPAMPPDPTCTNPLTIEFNAPTSTALPAGPFVFKAEGGTPPPPTHTGTLEITVLATVSNLALPTLRVVGPNTNQEQKVTWGTTWQVKNLDSGTYTITGTPVDNGMQYLAFKPVLAEVVDKQLTKKIITYKPIVTGNVTVNLLNAPVTSQEIVFTGKNYKISKLVPNGTSVVLPTDMYRVSATLDGYTTTITPSVIVVPTHTSLTISYKKTTTPPPTMGSGPFTTRNGQIVDVNNKPVTFQGVNWFGFNTGNHMLHGLWQADFNVMLNQIKAVGFNAVRIPFQFDFILDPSIKPSGITSTCNGKPCNGDIPQDSALKAFQYIVKKFTDSGLYVLIDDHYEDDLYVNHFQQWVDGWKKVAQLFVSNAMVGYDLWNEPDSHNLKWDSAGQGTPWATGIDNAAASIYSIDPKKLIFIEGVAQGALESNWGDGFATDNDAVSQGISNPKAFFTKAATSAYLNQIVVSPHMYGPDGTNNQGPDHSDQQDAYAAWVRLHGYLYNNFGNVNNTTQSGFCVGTTCHLYPLAIGEFGGKFDPADPYYVKDTATQINIATYWAKLAENKPAQLSWFYWDWNPNSGNTGGILKDDWATYDCNKVNYLKKYLQLKPATGICD